MISLGKKIWNVGSCVRWKQYSKNLNLPEDYFFRYNGFNIKYRY